MGDLHVYDRHIGVRIRLRRRLLGLTQADLGRDLAITAQQVQKYEKGENRISASMLLAIGHALDAPVSSFYEGLERDDTPALADARERAGPLEPSPAAKLLDALPEGPVKAAIEQVLIALTAEDVESLSPTGLPGLTARTPKTTKT